MGNNKLLKEISLKLIRGDATAVEKMTKEAVNQGIVAADILNNALISAMTDVGLAFQNNEIFLPEVLISARAMKAGMEILKPLLTASNFKARGKVCIGTVKGDLHDIGKNIVATMFEGAGYEIVDLGIDVATEKFVDSAKRHSPDIIAMSSLLTTTMLQMESVIEALEIEKLRHQIKVVVGGAPITSAFAEEIGADGYAPDAYGAVDMVKKLLPV